MAKCFWTLLILINNVVLIWQSIKESFTLNKPHIAEDFISRLMSNAQESESSVTFSPDHLNTCLSHLATEVMAREKQNYER